MWAPPPATLAGRLRKAVAHSADPQTGRLLREQTRRFERLTDRPAVRAMLCTDQHYPESFPDLLPRLRFGSCPPAPAKTASIMDRKSVRSEEHTSELQSLMRISYAVFCLKKKIINTLLLIQELNRTNITTRIIT